MKPIRYEPNPAHRSPDHRPRATALGPGRGQRLDTGRVAYASLFLRSKDGKLEPGLATGIKNVDEKTWDLSLRDNVKFHNGERFDAAAVKFSIERMLDPRLRR